MAKATSPIRIGSKVRVTSRGTGKIVQFLNEGAVAEVAMDTGGVVYAAVGGLTRVEAKESPASVEE